MTNEEALKILDTIPTISEQVDALEMAIKALQQYGALQKIRQEMIDKSYRIFTEYNRSYTEKLLYLADILEIIDKHIKGVNNAQEL